MQPLISPIVTFRSPCMWGRGLEFCISSSRFSQTPVSHQPFLANKTPVTLKPYHESRHNSYRAEDDVRPTEGTPLLHRFPRPDVRDPGSTSTTIVVTLLLIILISGVIIGIYLLVVQSNSENVLPPVETPLQLVSAAQWNPDRSQPVLPEPTFKAKRIVVVQTDTEPCHGTHSCAALLRRMTNVTNGMPYNFLVSSNGQTFEALGWRRSSSMFSEDPALVLAFIGNFTETPPTAAQVDEARNFFAESVSLRYLEPSYTVIGKNTKYTPKYLFQTLSKLPHWDKNLSDAL